MVQSNHKHTKIPQKRNTHGESLTIIPTYNYQATIEQWDKHMTILLTFPKKHVKDNE